MKKSYLCARKSIFTPRNRPFTDAKRDSDNVVPTNRIFRFDGLPRAQRQSQQVQDQRENRQAHHRRGQQSKLQAESAGQRFAHAENQHDRTARAGDRQPLLRQHRQHRHQRNEPARLHDRAGRHDGRPRPRTGRCRIARIAHGRRHHRRAERAGTRRAGIDRPQPHAGGAHRPLFRTDGAPLRHDEQLRRRVQRHEISHRIRPSGHPMYQGSTPLDARTRTRAGLSRRTARGGIGGSRATTSRSRTGISKRSSS